MATTTMFALIISLASTLTFSSVESTTFTFQNKCPYPVWPATQNGATSPPLSQTGFALPTGSASITLTAPPGWSGRFWPRTGCTNDSTGSFSCTSADCGSGQIACNGAGGKPPATLMEITLNGAGGQDFYDLSLVDGFNVPVSVVPLQRGSGSGCGSSSCAADVNIKCPRELQATDAGGAVVGCKSACLAFNTDEYCCRNAFGSPDLCKPSKYARMFKSACPQAYSYAFDDSSSTFTCLGAAGYLITFCPFNRSFLLATRDFSSHSTSCWLLSYPHKYLTPLSSIYNLFEDFHPILHQELPVFQSTHHSEKLILKLTYQS